MADRVQVLKWEAISQGGSSDDREPTPINPQEDAVECAGIYLQDATHRDTAAFISRHSSGMWQSSTGLLLPPGAAGAGKAPLKLQQGTAQTTPEDGVIEDIAGDITWVKSGTRTQLNNQVGSSGPTILFGYPIGFPPAVVNNGAVVTFSADRFQWEALNPEDGAVSLTGVSLANGDVPRWDSTSGTWVAVNPVLVRSLSGADISESSQSTVTPQAKISPSGSFVAGNYYVKWSCEIKSTTTYNVAGTFLIDAVEVGAMTMDTKGQYVMFGGYILTALAVGAHTFYLKYASGTAAQLAYIRRASVDIVRA